MTGKRMRKSYKSYLKRRKELEKKNIALADKMTYKEYKETYKYAKEAGESTNNFARTMAYDDMRVTRGQAKEIFARMDKDIKNEFDIKSIRQLRSSSDIHMIITMMFENGLIDDRNEFEQSLGY